MKDNHNFETLLEYLREAAIIVKDGYAVSANKKALAMLALDTPFPISIQCVNASGEITLLINGVSHSTVNIPTENADLYIILGTESPCENDHQILENLLPCIRSILSTKLSSVNILINRLYEKNDESALRYLAIIKHNIYQLANLSLNLENYLAFNENNGKLELRNTDLNDLCAKLTQTAALLLKDNDIDISFLPSRELLILNADAVKIETMLLSLIANLCKRLEKGGAIVLNLSLNGDNAVLTLSASGDEINSEITSFTDQERLTIFSGSYFSAQLDLMTALRIAHLHGGNILFSSSHSEVKTTITLPRKKSGSIVLMSDGDTYGSDAMRRVLTILSDVLRYDKYIPPYDD